MELSEIQKALQKVNPNNTQQMINARRRFKGDDLKNWEEVFKIYFILSGINLCLGCVSCYSTVYYWVEKYVQTKRLEND
jgi:hypothetical protein